MISEPLSTKISRRNFIRGCVYSSIALTGAVGHAGSDNLEIVKKDIFLSNLPSNLDGITIGVMADFHAGAWGNKSIVQQAFTLMQQQKPDMIGLLGDYVDGARSHNSKNVQNGGYIFEDLAKLQAPFGVYGVLGNHDHWTDAFQMKKMLKKAGVRLLRNESLVFENGLALAGVDDFWEGPAKPEKALRGIKPSQPIVLFSHNPDINLSLGKKTPVDLVLAGHTHGGQIRLPFTDWAPWIPCSPKYRGRGGVIPEVGGRTTFITKGVGTFLVPMRLNCVPDIALLRLKSS